MLYTDGLIERRDRDLDEGFAALTRAAEDLHGQPAETVCATLLDRLLPDQEHEDDVCLLVLRVLPPFQARRSATAGRSSVHETRVRMARKPSASYSRSAPVTFSVSTPRAAPWQSCRAASRSTSAMSADATPRPRACGRTPIWPRTTSRVPRAAVSAS